MAFSDRKLSDRKFRKWFKNGLKAQKILAQGIALGYYGRNPVAL